MSAHKTLKVLLLREHPSLYRADISVEGRLFHMRSSAALLVRDDTPSGSIDSSMRELPCEIFCAQLLTTCIQILGTTSFACRLRANTLLGEEVQREYLPVVLRS